MGTPIISYGGTGSYTYEASSTFPDVAIDGSGHVYFGNNYAIQSVSNSSVSTQTQTATVIVGQSGTPGTSGEDVAATSAKLLYSCTQFVVDPKAGKLYLSSAYSYTIRVVSGLTVTRGVPNFTGTIKTFAGQPGVSAPQGVTSSAGLGDGGAATSALFGFQNQNRNSNQFVGYMVLALDSSGNVYAIDRGAYRVRFVKVSSGFISTVAGTGIYGSSGDGVSATSAMLTNPSGIAVDSTGNLYIADLETHTIRVVNTAGIISTFAGTSGAGSSGDNGLASYAKLNSPNCISVDSSGVVYIGESTSSGWGKIRVVRFTTVCAGGYYGTPASTCSACPAGSTSLPNSASSASCTLCPASTYSTTAGSSSCTPCPPRTVNYAMGSTSAADCKPAPQVYIATVAGTGDNSFITNNVAATSSDLMNPSSVAVDALGNLYIGTNPTNPTNPGLKYDPGCFVQKVTKSTGIITTIAGKGKCGSYGDGGPATLARINPFGMALGKLTTSIEVQFC